MLSKKPVVTVVIPLAIICVPAQGNQYSGKRAGPTLLLEQEMYLFENDIFVARDDPQSASGGIQQRGIGLTSAFSRWINGLVPYQFHSNMSDGAREVAEQAIEHWNEKSSITLVARDPDIHPDFVEFVKGPGCASWVGRQGQAQEIWVSDYCTTGSMIHEIGHALGLLHEHTRSDRDQYIQVLWENIKQDKAFNFELNESGTIDLGQYNYNSIMHYGEYFFSATGDPTIQAINAPETATIGQRSAASAGDLAAIDALYGTDVALGVDASSTESSTNVTFTISNQQDVGAHAIVLSFSTGSSQDLVFGGDADVVCTNTAASVECTLDELAGSDMRQVSVAIPEVISEESMNVELSSKTFDNNLSNNGLPLLAAANAGNTVRSADSEDFSSTVVDGGAGIGGGGGGGGSMHSKGLLVLLALILFRVSGAVIASGRKSRNRKQHAFTRLAAPSRRTPR